MRRCRPALFALALMTGCTVAAAEVASTEASLAAGEARVARRDVRVLVRGAASTPAAQTDERPTYEMRVLGGDRELASPGRVLTGALVENAALWVRPDGTLVDDAAVVLDRDVLPELAVDPSGRFVAYPHDARSGGDVVVLDVARRERRVVSAGLAHADRPLFLDDGRLVVIGARASGIAGVWILDPDHDAPPVAVTNDQLRIGRPLGAAFVPPPAYHASMRVEGVTLVYDDGRAERRVALPEAP